MKDPTWPKDLLVAEGSTVGGKEFRCRHKMRSKGQSYEGLASLRALLLMTKWAVLDMEGHGKPVMRFEKACGVFVGKGEVNYFGSTVSNLCQLFEEKSRILCKVLDSLQIVFGMYCGPFPFGNLSG